MQQPPSKVDEILSKHLERTKQEEIVIENIAEYRLALKRIFSKNEGKLMAKYMLKFMGLFADDPQLNPAGLIEAKGRKSYYLKMIRPHLDKTLIMEIESYD